MDPTSSPSSTALLAQAAHRDPQPCVDDVATRAANQATCTWNPRNSGLTQHPAVRLLAQPAPVNPLINEQDLHFYGVYLEDRVLTPERLAEETESQTEAYAAAVAAHDRGIQPENTEYRHEHIWCKLQMLELHRTKLFPNDTAFPQLQEDLQTDSAPTSPARNLSPWTASDPEDTIISTDQEWSETLTANALRQRQIHRTPERPCATAPSTPVQRMGDRRVPVRNHSTPQSPAGGGGGGFFSSPPGSVVGASSRRVAGHLGRYRSLNGLRRAGVGRVGVRGRRWMERGRMLEDEEEISSLG